MSGTLDIFKRNLFYYKIILKERKFILNVSFYSLKEKSESSHLKVF